jgi:hypothetical protein
MIKRILCSSVVAAILLAGMAIANDDGFTANRHEKKNMDCNACHGIAKPKEAAPANSCITCHKSPEAIAEKTSSFRPNPHKNHLMESSDIECTQCHHGHKADTVMCNDCHSGMRFEKIPAETK